MAIWHVYWFTKGTYRHWLMLLRTTGNKAGVQTREFNTLYVKRSKENKNRVKTNAKPMTRVLEQPSTKYKRHFLLDYFQNEIKGASLRLPIASSWFISLRNGPINVLAIVSTYTVLYLSLLIFYLYLSLLHNAPINVLDIVSTYTVLMYDVIISVIITIVINGINSFGFDVNCI